MYPIYKISNLYFLKFHQPPAKTLRTTHTIRHLQILIHFGEKECNMVSNDYMKSFPNLSCVKKL